MLGVYISADRKVFIVPVFSWRAHLIFVCPCCRTREEIKISLRWGRCSGKRKLYKKLEFNHVWVFRSLPVWPWHSKVNTKTNTGCEGWDYMDDKDIPQRVCEWKPSRFLQQHLTWKGPTAPAICFPPLLLEVSCVTDNNTAPTWQPPNPPQWKICIAVFYCIAVGQIQVGASVSERNGCVLLQELQLVQPGQRAWSLVGLRNPKRQTFIITQLAEDLPPSENLQQWPLALLFDSLHAVTSVLLPFHICGQEMLKAE